jgi:D-alanyl-D-alanine carboxypeptidase (penicillin-binding protein 5/6)
VDARDGAVLASRDPDREVAIASTTKLMTAYLALRDLRFRQRITTPHFSTIPGEALLGLQPGERDTVHDLLYGLLLPSGGDAAITLATGDAGSIPAFVSKMNATAVALGLDRTHYSTPVGLDTPGNYSTATDLAKLARILLRDRRFARIVDTASATLTGGDEVRQVVNRNDLVARYPWVVGVKTGYTLDARYVLVAAGRRHGSTLISVVLGAPRAPARDDDSLDLLRYGFSLYRPNRSIAAGQALAHPEIRDGTGRLALVAAHPVRVWTRPGQRVEVARRAPRTVRGPIRRGRRLGRATVPVPAVPAGVERALPGDPDGSLVRLAGVLGVAGGVVILAASGAGRLRDTRRRG